MQVTALGQVSSQRQVALWALGWGRQRGDRAFRFPVVNLVESVLVRPAVLDDIVNDEQRPLATQPSLHRSARERRESSRRRSRFSPRVVLFSAVGAQGESCQHRALESVGAGLAAERHAAERV